MGKYGYGVVKKAYKAALVQNMMRAGGTYINSALTKVIVADGVWWLLTEAGLGAAVVENAKNVIPFVTSSAGSKAMERGIWVRCRNKGNLVS